jgi:subtilisin-like proprotein convertase family protein
MGGPDQVKRVLTAVIGGRSDKKVRGTEKATECWPRKSQGNWTKIRDTGEGAE